MTQSVIRVGAGRFINAFLVRGAGGSILVDTGNPGSQSRILEGIAQAGVDPEEITLILITHGHVDHYGSAAALRERLGAPVGIHALDAEGPRQGTHQPDTLHPTNWLVGFLMRFPALRRGAVPERAPSLEPDVLFDEERRLDDYGVAGRLLHTPGHTPGSISLLLDNGEALLGDVVIDWSMGLMPTARPPIVAWDLERDLESVRRLASLSPRVVYTGHGGPLQDLSRLVDGE